MSDLPTIRILNLYPEDMNIYGDSGNILALTHRIRLHGLESVVIEYNVGDEFPTEIDMIIGGGGQDSGQDRVQADLQKIGSTIKTLAIDDMPMLMICGLYQLFGHEFITGDDRVIEGIGLFDVTTKAGPERLIGNIVTHSDQLGELIGYENHSGLTTLGPKATPLARVIKGAGNNGSDHNEGVIFQNVIGSYLHGPLLPKNPRLTDFLIARAAERAFGAFKPAKINDSLIDQTRKIARERPR